MDAGAWPSPNGGSTGLARTVMPGSTAPSQLLARGSEYTCRDPRGIVPISRAVRHEGSLSMPAAKRRDNWPPRVRQVVDLVNDLLGLKPWYHVARPGGRFVKWKLPDDRDWEALAQVVRDLLEEKGVWQDGCIEVVVEKNSYFQDSWHLRVTAYQDPQPRLLKKLRDESDEQSVDR